jgi:hypothetical protein
MEASQRADGSLSKGLAYFSMALGAAEVLAPKLLSRAIGLEPRPALMRALGLREIATGIGMLSLPGSPAGPGARVAGDAVDLAVVALTSGLSSATRKRRIIALLAVAGVAALDVYATRKLAARHRAVDQGRRRNRIPTVRPAQAEVEAGAATSTGVSAPSPH